jgi:hypothetical protein
MLRRHLDRARRRRAPDPLADPPYEELSVRSAVLAYVVGEGHHDETIFALADWFSPSGDSDVVERAVRDFVGAELLTIRGGKVNPGRAWLADSSIP